LQFEPEQGSAFAKSALEPKAYVDGPCPCKGENLSGSNGRNPTALAVTDDTAPVRVDSREPLKKKYFYLVDAGSFSAYISYPCLDSAPDAWIGLRPR
jgi:hypothetical protein